MLKFFAVETYFNWGSDTSVAGILSLIFGWLFAAVGMAVVGGIVYGAILYTSSAGNSGQAQKAIGIIRNSVIALILYAVFWVVIEYLVLPTSK